MAANRRGPAHKPPIRTRPHLSSKRPKRYKIGSATLAVFVFSLTSVFIMLTAKLFHIQVDVNNNNAGNIGLPKNNGLPQRLPAEFPNKKNNNKGKDSKDHENIHSASIDQVVEFLLQLARMPPTQLREALSAEKDIFQLQQLEQKGICPFSPETASTVPWLPSSTDKRRSELFKTRNDRKGAPPHVMVWYEHLSKAGGTSFCKLANKNMPKRQVPGYYCMPSEGKVIDARCGTWSNDKLQKYISEHPHRLVSNEWQPFPLERLDYPINTDQMLLFVTTIRDPLNRLLSAYNFWGVLHDHHDPHPNFPEWLSRQHGVSHRHKPYDWEIHLHVSRYNFIAWKFSNGTMPLSFSQNPGKIHHEFPPKGLKGEATPAVLRAFETAVRTLSKFDLVLVTEIMSAHPEPLQSVLGWDNLDDVHVVPSGKIVNNDAKFLPKETYDILWEANRFDIILYDWMKAVYLARIRCSDALMQK